MVIITKIDTYNPLTKCPKCGFGLYLAQDVSYNVKCPPCGTLIREKTDPNKIKNEDTG
jgi:ribosomal protein S27E